MDATSQRDYFQAERERMVRTQLAERGIRDVRVLAAMLQHLALQATDRALDVGTGSGYVTALLSLLCAEVYSVERHAQLVALAESTLHRLGYRNVKIRVGDGSQGWL